MAMPLLPAARDSLLLAVSLRLLPPSPYSQVIVATKVAGFAPHLTYLRDSKAPTRVDPSNIEESVNKSLKRLGVDHIDLLQIHW